MAKARSRDFHKARSCHYTQLKKSGNEVLLPKRVDISFQMLGQFPAHATKEQIVNNFAALFIAIILGINLLLPNDVKASTTTPHDPIIYVHGVGVPSFPFEKIVPLPWLFKKLGYRLYIAKTPATASLEESSQVLLQEIKRLVPLGRYHLIGHSMGGLVARLALSQNIQESHRCLSLTTISTPNHGAPVADWVLKEIERASSSRLLQRILDFFGNDIEVVRQLSTKYVEHTFNLNVMNSSNVKYFSLGFYIPNPTLLYTQNPYMLLANKINSDAGFPLSDGPVTIESANWGKSLGIRPGDHYSSTSEILFGGKIIYADVMRTITNNLNQEFYPNK